ncbi:MAG: glycosyltransferase family 39 protein [Patescibacteria group bacterium]|nr:glycosyltransferase family 39 protein [Patescibacteria group bacterium]
MNLKKNLCKFRTELLISLFYLLIHIPKLVNLPVFADEAIYIRWSQLIIDDPKQYLFFALNDGKTPLFIWLLTPLQFIFSDQLFAGRFLSVLVGLVQIWVLKVLVKTYGGKKPAQYFAMAAGSLLPFWYFHQRMALMDGLLALLLSLSLLFTTKNVVYGKRKGTKNNFILNISMAGLFAGLALLVKLPAILFLPALFTPLILTFKHEKQTHLLKNILSISCSVLVSLLIFACLKLHPAFGQLFNRGGDFLFTIREFLFEKQWQHSLQQLPTYGTFFLRYLTVPVVFLSFLGLFSKKRLEVISLHFNWLLFSLPIILLGKVVYPRYFMPIAIGVTVAASLSVEQFINKNSLGRIITTILLLLSLGCSSKFIYHQLTNVESTPFVNIDKTQYLTSWSAGYGIKESVAIINQLSKNKKTLVLTEGYFGSLPDGLLMYYHRRPVDNIYITGIGQPIHQIPQNIIDSNQSHDQVLLIVNSNRLKMDLKESPLIFAACRPDNSPCHQIWDITSLFHN